MEIYTDFVFFFYPSLIVARTCHVESGIRYPIVPRMFTDPNSMKYLREES